MNNSARRRVKSAKTVAGGPATYTGTNYQTDCAVRFALELIERTFAEAATNLEISLEPRLISAGTVTAWDIRVRQPSRCIEAKSNVTGSDVLDWIARTKEATATADEQTFLMVYGAASPMLLKSLDNLIRVAREVSEAKEFNRLIAEISLPRTEKIMEVLGDDAFCVLRRAEPPELLSTAALTVSMELYAKELAGPRHASDLRAFLFEKMSKASSRRLTYRIADLISEAEATRGIKFQSPRLENISGLSDAQRGILAVLHTCPEPISGQVLAATGPDFDAALDRLAQEGHVSAADGHYALIKTPARPDTAGLENYIAAALQGTLALIERNGPRPMERDQIANAIAMSKKCFATHPKLVAGVFGKLDKHLKNRGDKHLVLHAADLSISAARRAFRDIDIVKDEAKALICGRSWVLQRIGNLEAAELHGRKSLQIGQNIEWDRNTAYCMKCLGRLFRLQAERAAGSARNRLLAESEEFLKDAIDRFNRLHEPDSEDEKGDCLSLLGRTYLVAGRRSEADQAVKESRRLIPEDGRKDDLDLKILMGDLRAAAGFPNDAISLYDEVIRQRARGAEFSEICARAHMARARAFIRLKERSAALDSLHQASAIYKELNEPEAEAEARWEELVASDRISGEAMRVLSGESYAVRMRAIEHFESENSVRGNETVARRAQRKENRRGDIFTKTRRFRAVACRRRPSRRETCLLPNDFEC